MDEPASPSDSIAPVDYAGWHHPSRHDGPTDATLLRGLRWLITAIVLLPCTLGLLLLLAGLLLGRNIFADLAQRMM